jgi:hypothetical protein
MACKTLSRSAMANGHMKLVDDHASEFTLSLVGRSGYSAKLTCIAIVD